MLEDDKAPSEAQARQTAAGQYIALSAALHALIGSHPNPTAFSKLFDQYAEISSQILLTKTALQADEIGRAHV